MVSPCRMKLAATADGRHRIGYEHGAAEATQRKAEHRGIDVHAVDDQAVPGIGGLQCLCDRSGFAAGQRPHGIEKGA